jgi:integrase
VPTIELTSRRVAGLKCPAGANEIIYWSRSLPCFGLRIRASDVRTWVAMARLKGVGKIVKRTLGDPTTVTFNEAQATARDWLSEIKRGIDPQEAARGRRQAIGMDALIARYLAHQERTIRARSYTEVRRHLLVNAKPLHNKLAVDVGQRDVVELLQKIAARAPTQANRTRSNLSALFGWGMKAGLVPANPIIATFIPAVEQPRDRVLSDEEITWVWSCTNELTRNDEKDDFAKIVRLLVLTGARRTEVGGMCESELVRHGGPLGDGSVTWTIPGERTKNKLPLELVLPAWIAKHVPLPLSGDNTRDHLFGADSAIGFNGWKHGRARLDRMIKQAGHVMAPWVLHDLRRTFVTRLNDLGVLPFVIEALVNHVSGGAKAGIAGTYNKAAYREPKKAALALWSEHVRSLVETDAPRNLGDPGDRAEHVEAAIAPPTY